MFSTVVYMCLTIRITVNIIRISALDYKYIIIFFVGILLFYYLYSNCFSEQFRLGIKIITTKFLKYHFGVYKLRLVGKSSELVPKIIVNKCKA